MSTDNVLIGTIIFLFIFGAAISLVVQDKKNKIRTIHLKRIADKLNLGYKERENIEKLEPINKCSFILKKATHLALNLINGSFKEVDYTVFDFRQNTLAARTIRATILLIKSDITNFPFFIIRRKYLADSIIRFFNERSVYFDRNSLFSSKYYVSGKNPQVVRRLFNERIFTFFKNQQNSCIEGFGHYLIYYRNNELIKPEKIKSFIDEGFEIYNLFKENSRFME